MYSVKSSASSELVGCRVVRLVELHGSKSRGRRKRVRRIDWHVRDHTCGKDGSIRVHGRSMSSEANCIVLNQLVVSKSGCPSPELAIWGHKEYVATMVLHRSRKSTETLGSQVENKNGASSSIVYVTGIFD